MLMMKLLLALIIRILITERCWLGIPHHHGLVIIILLLTIIIISNNLITTITPLLMIIELLITDCCWGGDAMQNPAKDMITSPTQLNKKGSFKQIEDCVILNFYYLCGKHYSDLIFIAAVLTQVEWRPITSNILPQYFPK